MTVGIVAILCAIAIPSIITLNRSMNDRHLNNSARAVYLSAQSNLAQMRSSGDLAALAAMTSDDGARNVPRENENNAYMGDDWNEQLRFTVTGTTTETDAFEMILPANILDAQIRDQQILIEYNPFSGHVYAVFYSEGDQELSYSSIVDRKDEAALKEKGIGYYCGGSVTIAPAEVNSTAVTLSADTDGQELIASVVVPVPESYTNNQNDFREYLSAELTVIGESSGTELVFCTQGETVVSESVNPAADDSKSKELCIGSPNYVEFSFILESFNKEKAFVGLNFDKFIPGENLTLAASVTFNAPEGETILTFDEVVITGVNSLFSRMEETTDASGNVVSYAIELSNGRHLQNLNALDSSIAAKVETIELAEDIYWNETVEYYTDAYVTSTVARAAEAVTYELFTPIDTSMFKPEEGDTSVTSFDGKNHRVLYLDIEGTGNVGLFGLCQIDVANLAIVSPIIKGGDYTGTLAGYANGAKFTNCSVYIDTEDEYFSWDKMEEYGVTGETAGGLVGYATSGTFSNCFAAVNVDAAENAGGFVGYSDGADATMCYASGNVTGKTAGGFVGVNENTEYKQCFASGDVYADDTTGASGGFVGELKDYSENVITFRECYAVGVVDGKKDSDTVKATVDGFCGTGLEESEETVYQNAYYLNREEDANVVSLCAAPVNYKDLTSKTQYATDAVQLTNWDYAAETHRYSVTEDGEYPFLVYSDTLHYYGDWPEETYPVVLAYYEEYESNENGKDDETGYYITSEKTATLQNDRVILNDGYVLLVQRDDVTVSVVNGKATLRKDNNDKAVTYNSYYIYDFDLNAYDANSAFYTEVEVNVSWTDDQSQPQNKTYELYYNPNFALTQVNAEFDSAGNESEEAEYDKKIPSTIYIRTARHLAAIAENADYQGSIYNYIQMIDVDFGSYDWGTAGYAMKPIADFAGSYTGAGGYVSQAKIVLKDAVTLFTKITGKVSHVDVVASDLGGLDAGFVTLNEGEILNCTVGPVGDEIDSGYPIGALTYGFAKENSGTIRGSMANTAATAAAFVGTNSGTIADCYAWYPGTTADTETEIVFAETDKGEIVSSYAAIYGDPAYVLVYDRDGVAAFRNTLAGVTLGENWYSYSDAIAKEKGYYPYSTPDGIAHRGGWSVFKEYEAFTGYYYYETYEDSTEKGLYIEIIGQDDKEPVYSLKDMVPDMTAYGIFTITPNEMKDESTLEQAALTLNSAPIVPAEVYKDELEKLFKDIFDSKEQTYTYEFKELSSQSVYILNGTEINTWFAPVNDDGAYRIRTPEQFAAIEEFRSESFIQETDITIEKPLTYFEGTYDGGQNTITHKAPLTVTLDAANGEEVEIDDGNGGKTTVIRDNVAYGLLVNVTGEDAVIKNCRVIDPVITVTEDAKNATTDVDVEITAAIGGLVGENHGTVKTSSVEGLSITHTAATVSDGVTYSADIAVGGLVGHMADGGLYECFVSENNEKTAIFMATAANGSKYTVGGAVGVVDAVEEASVTCMDSYAAVNIAAPNATVGAFVGEAEEGTFYACHGWNGGAFIGKGADAVRLLKCYYAQDMNGTYKIWTYDGLVPASLSYESLAQWVRSLNDDRGDIWDTETTEVDENGNNGATYDTKYPVLAGRYDANADGDANLYVEAVTINAPKAEATEAPTETAEPETTPETTEQPDVTVEPETTEQPDVTAEPEATEIPAETAVPEVTPEPTAEPTPVPTETPVVEVTPESTAETEPVSEDA